MYLTAVISVGLPVSLTAARETALDATNASGLCLKHESVCMSDISFPGAAQTGGFAWQRFHLPQLEEKEKKPLHGASRACPELVK